MDGWVGFVVARYLGLWRHDTIEGYDGTEGGSLWSPIINFPGLGAPSSFLHTSQTAVPACLEERALPHKVTTGRTGSARDQGGT